jgi:hypothetical protein
MDTRDDLLTGLNFVVQYRRHPDSGVYDPWHTMAAFDGQLAAERYYEKQSSDTWIYRLVELTSLQTLAEYAEHVGAK